MSESKQNHVFISYSHADEEWKKKVETILKPLSRNAIIDLWSDKRIRTGDLWRSQIESAINHASVALLLVSPNFFNSEFIAHNELPPLLAAAQQRGLWIIWLPIDYCLFDEAGIEGYQAAHDPSTPLSSLPDHEVSKILTAMGRDIRSRLQSISNNSSAAIVSAPERQDNSSVISSSSSSPALEHFPWPALLIRANSLIGILRLQLDPPPSDFTPDRLKQIMDSVAFGSVDRSLQISLLSRNRTYLYHIEDNRIGSMARHIGIEGRDMYADIFAVEVGAVAWTDYANYMDGRVIYGPQVVDHATSQRIRRSIALFATTSNGLKIVIEMHHEE